MAEQTVAKPWYKSKLIIVNILSALAMVWQSSRSFLPSILKSSRWDSSSNVVLRGISSGTVTMTAETARLKNAGVAILIVFMSLNVVGCAMKGGGKSPERQIATYGIQVVSALDEVSMTAKEFEAQKIITTEQYKVFLVNVRKAYEGASKLATALQVYDKEASTSTASQVSAALNALSAVVPAVTAGIGGPGTEKIVSLVSEVNKLVLNIALMLKRPEPTPPPEAPALEQFPALEGAY
jgi:hypothetical protein